MNNDPFDLTRLKLTPEQTAELAPLQKKPKPKPQLMRAARPAKTRFVQLPYDLAAASRLKNAPLAVLLEVAYLTFKAHQKPVPLGNRALQAVGMSRWAKTRALRQLEIAGFVNVVWQSRGSSPLVSLRWN
jgi:hypothetical protein